jgi:polyhydroxybutyrate depolymerase
MLILALLGCTQPSWPETAPADPCAAGAIGPEERVLRLEVDDLQRQALVWMPEGPGPHDVIVTLHEMSSEPKRQAFYTGMIELAKRQNAILVGPDGKTASWNAGACCGKSKMRGYADMQFLDEVVARVDAVACTSGRVLATGIGAGGMMAHRWACGSDVPDAVLSVGGGLQVEDCPQTRPIPVVHYHGSVDYWMPADGSGGHMPLSHSVDLWSKRNRATEGEKLEGGALSCRELAGDAPLRFCTVDGMKDLWPGADDAKFTGPDGQEIDATEQGWAFVSEAWAGLGAKGWPPEARGEPAPKAPAAP